MSCLFGRLLVSPVPGADFFTVESGAFCSVFFNQEGLTDFKTNIGTALVEMSSDLGEGYPSRVGVEKIWVVAVTHYAFAARFSSGGSLTQGLI